MNNSGKMARLAVEDMSARDEAEFLKWLVKRAPAKVEGEALNSATRWWLAKLKSGNVLPGIGWPAMLLIDDLAEDYINALGRNITRRGNATAMGRFLKQVGAVEKNKPSYKARVTIRAGEPGGEGLKPGAVIKRTKRSRRYVLHGLDECRARFDQMYGKQRWAEAE